MGNETQLDAFLEKYSQKYDKWMAEGQISYSSKVIPVSESFDARQWVLPTEQVLKLLETAESIALQECACRSHYKHCEKPLDVCLMLNKSGDKAVAVGNARHISLDTAIDVLKKANESGLIHMSLYMPDHEVFALCSCCPCCCHDLQIIKRTGRNDIMMRSDYVAVTDFDNCIHCGDCEERCFFDARMIHDIELEFDFQKCVGCGLCVTICPAGAISMVIRHQRTLSVCE